MTVRLSHTGRLLGALALALCSCGPPTPGELLESGREAILSGELDRAVASLSEAADGLPGDASARYWLGRALLEAGRAAEAEAALRQALELDARDATALRELGRALLDGGRPAEAVAALSDAAELDPLDASAAVWLGRALQAAAEGRALPPLEALERAEQSLRRAVELDPRRPDARLELARTLSSLGLRDAAREQVAAAVTLPGVSLEQRIEAAHLVAAAGDAESAAQLFAAAAERLEPGPRRDGVRLAHAAALTQAGRFDEALAVLPRGDDPTLLAESLYWEGRARCGRGELAEGLRLLTRHLELEPRSAEGAHWAGRCAYASFDFERARQLLTRALDEQPGHAAARHWLGRSRFWLGEPRAAAFELAAAADAAPDDADAHLWTARARLGSGDLDGAAGAAFKVWSLAGDADAAESALAEVLALAPSSSTAHRLTGVLLLMRGRIAEAVEHLERAAAAAEPDPETFAYLGWALLGAGDAEAADAAFERALGRASREPWRADGQPFAPLAFEGQAFARLAADPDLALYPFEILESARPASPSRIRTGLYWTLRKLGAAGRADEVRGPFAELGAVGFWDGALRVVHVVGGSPADEAGLQPGDLLERLGATELRDEADWDRRLAAVPLGNPTLLGVRRGGEELALVVHLGPPSAEEAG